MRHFVLSLILLGVATSNSAAEYYDIDGAHTFPHFAVSHLGFSTLYGRFEQTRGKILIDRAHNSGFVDVKISAVSVSTGHKKRDQHLRSPDFFNVMEYPDISFKSTSIDYIDKDKAKIIGDLTLLGVSKSVTLSVNRIICGKNPVNKKQTCGFEAVSEIMRSDFGMTYGLPGVGDKVKLWFQVEAQKEE